MKPLALKFKKNGFDYEQVYRKDDVAIYKQSQGRGVWFETIVVQKNAEREIAGVLIAASESMPGNQTWGAKGWTFGDFRAAMAKAVEIQENRDRRKNGLLRQL